MKDTYVLYRFKNPEFHLLFMKESVMGGPVLKILQDCGYQCATWVEVPEKRIAKLPPLSKNKAKLYELTELKCNNKNRIFSSHTFTVLLVADQPMLIDILLEVFFLAGYGIYESELSANK